MAAPHVYKSYVVQSLEVEDDYVPDVSEIKPYQRKRRTKHIDLESLVIEPSQKLIDSPGEFAILSKSQQNSTQNNDNNANTSNDSQQKDATQPKSKLALEIASKLTKNKLSNAQPSQPSKKLKPSFPAAKKEESTNILEVDSTHGSTTVKNIGGAKVIVTTNDTTGRRHFEIQQESKPSATAQAVKDKLKKSAEKPQTVTHKQGSGISKDQARKAQEEHLKKLNRWKSG